MKKKNVDKEVMKEVLNTISSSDAKNVRGGANDSKDAAAVSVGIRITF